MMPWLLACALLLLTGGARGSGGDSGDGCPGGTPSYNGICTLKDFPPRQNYSRAVLIPPYLKAPPPLINITKGRQLFVDDFLIASKLDLRKWVKDKLTSKFRFGKWQPDEGDFIGRTIKYSKAKGLSLRNQPC